jgi:glycosyltransferase involved in cell wall biosynthesis
VLAVSASVAEALKRQYPALASRTSIVPNPIDTAAFRLTDEPAGDSPDGPVILYTGRIHPEKGLDLLVQACVLLTAEIPGLELRIIGESSAQRGGGMQDYVDVLKRKAAPSLRLSVLPPIRERHLLAEALRRCDVYCYPSIAEHGESFGVAPLEAMGVGCAVVVSALDCFRDFLEPGHNGLVFDHRGAGAASRLRDAIRTLLSDTVLAKTIGRAGARTAREYSFRAIAEQYLNVFESTLRERAAGAD